MHSTNLRFSAGAMNGSYGAIWQESVSREPPAELVQTLALAGFDGIYVDRQGVGEASVLEAALTQLLGAPLSSPAGDLSFFRLASEKQRLAGTPAWAERESVTKRVITQFSGFFPVEKNGAQTWRWSSGRAQIRLRNPSSTPRSMDVSFRLYAPSPKPVKLHLTGLARQDFVLSNARQVFERRLLVPGGGGELVFVAEGEPIVPPRDVRRLSFAVEDFTLRTEP
jgi:phosphoglycerol transferase